jgi:AAA+ ATPase superfamily predicted ATPase
MTFIVRRRRIGKTSLLVNANADKIYLYFFVAKKNEALLCMEFVEEIKQKLQIGIFGTIKTFKELFGYLMELSRTRHFTLIIDEFQEFDAVNPSVYSDMQDSWDSKRNGDNISIPSLQQKAEKITQQIPDYQIEFTVFSMDDM